MCGIVGYTTGFINGFNHNEAKMFHDMLVLDTLRGFDSTGVFGVSNRGNVAVVKDALNGASFVRTKEYEDFHTSIVRQGLFAVGHNRAATRGTITDKNAHPFNIDDKIILVQNGTYKGSHTHLKDTEVDTEAVAHVIADEEDVSTALQKINAAYALVWYNVKTKTLNIIRNDERPMYIAYTKTGGTVFASEREIILTAASRNDVELVKPPYLLKEGCLVTMKINDKQSYDEDCNEIKYKFDYSQQVPSFRQEHTQAIRAVGQRWYGNTDDLDADDGAAPVGRYVHMAMNSPEYMQYSLSGYIADGVFTEDFAVNTGLADELVRLAHGDRGVNAKKTLIQLCDYLPCNDNKNCNSFFLYGRKFQTDNSPSAMYYMLVKNVTEADVVNMVYNEFYYVSTTTAYRSPLSASVADPNCQYIATVFCMDPECAAPLEVTEETKNDQVH